MKFGKLQSVGHNIAFSLASGEGLMIGVYEIGYIFDEAAKSAEGYILVDFLAGTTSGAKPSALLAKSISSYSKALKKLCQKHEIEVEAFRELKARYLVASHGERLSVTVDDQMGRREIDIVASHGERFFVTVEDQMGRRSIDEYDGRSGKHVMVLDPSGRRIYRKRHQASA